MGGGAREDWAMQLERLANGDRQALIRLTRLVGGFLSRWNAYDFRDDWDDLIQDVLIAAVEAHRQGRIEQPGHVFGFLKTIARNKFVDRLKRKLRVDANGSIPWESVVDGPLDPGDDAPEPEIGPDVAAALAGLDSRHRSAIVAVYVEGRTQPEAAASTGIPLGSLRRYLREGLAQLGRSLAPHGEGGVRSAHRGRILDASEGAGSPPRQGSS